MAAAQWTVTKQMMTASNAAASNPGDLHIPIGLWSAGTGWATRVALYAPISFSGMTSINAAYVYLRANAPSSGYHTKGTSTSALGVRRKTADWSETSHGGSSAIDEVWGGDGTAVVNANWVDDGGTNATSIPNMTDGAWYAIDITAIARMWLAGYANYGVMIYNASSEGSSSFSKQFWSRHASGSQPYIYIDYNTNQAPLAPFAMSPAGGIVHTGASVTFSGDRNDFDPDDYATGVNVQVWNSGQNTIFIDDTTTFPGVIRWSRTLSLPALNSDYTWRARARDSGGLWGPFSGFIFFHINTVPGAPSTSIAQTPTNAIKTLTPIFNITNNDPDTVNGDAMASYYVEVWRDGPSGGGGTQHWVSGQIVNPAGTQSVQKLYNGPALSWRTSYWLYVRTIDNNGASSPWSGFSPAVSFTTYSSPPPINLTPTGGEVVNGLTPTFTGARGDTNHTISSYQIQVYASDGTTLKWDSGVLSTGIVNGASFSKAYAGSALSYGTQYKWRAQITGNIGGTSNWTSLQTINTPTATTPTQTAPVGSPVTTLTPTFTGSWTEALNAVQIIVYEADGTTVKWDSGTLTQTSATTYSKVYAGPALSWNTTYKWKIRVRRTADNIFQNYTGLVTFTTDSAGQPTLTAPIDNSWQTTTTPTFTGTTFGGEVISTFRILLYEADGVTLTWDSGDLAGSGTSFSKVYNGANALVPGRTYKWHARYVKSTGPTGNYSAQEDFHVNAAPQAPSSLSPGAGGVVIGTLLPTFTATYEDVDLSSWGDFPVQMEIEVRNNATDALIATQTKTTGLVAGVNSITWDGTPALVYETTYKWRVRYRDSKNVDGAWSAYNTFKPSQPSSVTITSPGSTIVSPQVPVIWSFSSPSGKPQKSYRVRVIRNSDSIQQYDSGTVLSSANNHTVPAGFLVNNTEYTFEVTTVDTDGI